MATIVTVHGTFATGPETGKIWWQRESPFMTAVLPLVEASAGTLAHMPIIWDGLNSESSRREAGRLLYDRLAALEAAGEPYVVVGHSHGGSVISSALMLAARRRRNLDGLRRWITIGTPFIETARGPFLFHRLGVFGKSAYVALLTVLLAVLTVTVRPENRSALCPGMPLASLQCGLKFGLSTLIFLLPFLAFYGVIRYFEFRRLHLYNRRVTQFADTAFRSRWLSLWHRNDEAIQGLKSLHALKLSLFARDFAVKPLSVLSIVLLPLLTLALIRSGWVMTHLFAYAVEHHFKIRADLVHDGHLVGMGGDFLANNQFLIDFVGTLATRPLMHLAQLPLDGDTPLWISILGLFSVSAIATALAMVLTYGFNALCFAASAGLARILNPVTMGQIRAQAFGSDTTEDHAVDAREWPMWLGLGLPPLPDPLAPQLQAFSDEAVSRAVPKFRNAVKIFAASEDDRSRSDMFSEYLTWDELIHTAYFKNDHFRKLVAYAVSEADGFRASESFKRDPDHAIVAGWFQLLASRPDPAAPASVATGG